MNSAISQEGQNLEFSIPIEQVMPLAENWSKHPLSVQSKSDLVYGKKDMQVNPTDAEELVKTYYELINKQDYVSAYALRGSDMQSTLTYEQFRSGYTQTIKISLQKMYSQQESKDRVSVTSVLEIRERTRTGEYRILQSTTIIQVGYENDRLKLLDGKQEMIK